MEDDLRQIITSAVKLDDIFESSRSMFRMTMQVKSLSNLYDDSLMQAIAYLEEPTRNTEIDFVVSPVLKKNGNADGRSYESQVILAKAEVVCP